MIAAAHSRAPSSPAPIQAPPPLLVPEPYPLGPLQKRQQEVAPDNPDYPQCNNVPNYQLSCWPTADIALLQNKWYHFVWNSRYITFVQNTMVDVYLYQADSNLPVTNWTRQWTADGWLAFQVNDDWWGPRGLNWRPGKNESIPFYFVVVESGHTFVGGEPKQPTFYAIQTGPVAAAVSSSLSAAHAASVASSSRAAATASSTPAPSLQNNAVDQSFPSWAIALLVVLGVLAFVSILILAFLLLRSARRKRAKRRRSQRDSMGSASPMMAGIAPQSPVATTIGPPVRQSTATSYPHHDAASSTSHAHSSDVPPPISTDDAAFVANAFRRGLRNPDFSGRPIEEGESPEQKDQPPGGTEGNERLTRELAEEGTGLRSVSSERGVRVQTLSDEEGTVMPAR